MGAPTELIMTLKSVFNLPLFVETGTYHGDTAAWAANQFQSVITMEYARTFFDRAVTRFQTTPNVRVIFGHSGVEMGNVIPTLNAPALFWLDSHWSGGETYGEVDECPLLEELDAILKSPHRHFLLIDDARLFLSAPPEPHNPAVWPTLNDIMARLHPAYDVVVIEDNIIATPQHARALIVEYCQHINTMAWEQYGDTIRRNRLQRGALSIQEGVQMLGGALADKLRRWR